MPTPDAGPVVVDAGDVAMPETPMAPAPPASPVLTPCAAGWHEVPVGTDADAPAACEPWPDGAPLACTARDEAHFPGELGCRRVGSACPTGDFPEGLPSGPRVLYVLAAAAPGGDGTLAAPFATVREAAMRAVRGDIVAVGRGTYDEFVAVGAGVTLWGACVASTTIASSAPTTYGGSILPTGDAVVVRNLTLGGILSGIWVEGATTSVELDDVIIDGAHGAGIAVQTGAHLAGHDVVVRDTQPVAGSPGASAVSVTSGGAVELTGAVLARSLDVAVLARGVGTSVRLTGAAILDTRAVGAVHRGYAIFGVDGATTELTDSTIEGYGNAAVLLGAGSAHLTGSVVRGAQPDELGRALDTAGGAIVASRVRVTDAGQFGVFAAQGAPGATPSVALTDVLVDARHGDPAGAWGGGVAVFGGTASLARVWVEETGEVGIIADGPSTVVDAQDVTIRGAAADARRGAELQHSSDVTLRRFAALGMHELGVWVTSAHATLEDVVVLDTDVGPSSPIGGDGIVADTGATVGLSRAELRGGRTVGLLLSGDGTQATATDLAVRETRSNTDGMFGRGAHVQTGASLTLTRALFDHNRDEGLLASGDLTHVVASDVAVVDTLPKDCATTTCAGMANGMGVGSYSGAGVELARFLVARSTLAGLQVTTGGTIDAHDGVVSSNPIGVNAQSAGFDLRRLMDHVVYLENGTNIDASGLVVPDLTPVPSPVDLGPP